MSLPDRWVNALFAKLTVTFGQSFLRQYDGVPIEEVKANWANELSVFQQSPDAIRHGLDHLPPDRAPNVLQFREACRRAPTPVPPALPAPKPDPEVARQVRAAFAKERDHDPRGWAFRLKEREEAGEVLTMVQKRFWREAVGI